MESMEQIAHTTRVCESKHSPALEENGPVRIEPIEQKTNG
jgi:hypothetical protein